VSPAITLNTYDALNRLTQVANGTPASQENYRYDPLGNRTAKSVGQTSPTLTAYVYDAANQLKEIHSGSTAGPLLASLAYDANGSLTSRSDSGLTLGYDALNRLTQATLGGQVSGYAYDDQGRRIQKTVAGSTTNFLYNGPDIVAEYATSWGLPTAQYTHGPNQDEPIERITQTGAQYFHQDGLGSVVGVTDTTTTTRANVALAANGGVASASSTYSSNYLPQSANDGDHKGINWGAGGGWNDATNNVWPDWLQIDFAATRTLNEIDVYTVQDNGGTAEPTPSMSFTQSGITAFDVQYWNGSAWITLSSVTGNNLVWRKFSFSPVTTSKIRIMVYGGANTPYAYSRIVEVEAYTVDSAVTQRFDAWGNQIAATGTQPRFGYTGREPDETGLVYYRARYYNPGLGRFVSRDPIGLQGGINNYAYVGNNPVNYADPSGNCGPFTPLCAWLAETAPEWGPPTLGALKTAGGFALGYGGAAATGTVSTAGRIAAGLVGAAGLGNSTKVVEIAKTLTGLNTYGSVAVASGTTASFAEGSAQLGDVLTGTGEFNLPKIPSMGLATAGVSLLGGEAALASFSEGGGPLLTATSDTLGALHTAVGSYGVSEVYNNLFPEKPTSSPHGTVTWQEVDANGQSVNDYTGQNANGTPVVNSSGKH
jgi:RHS repeat-associated protein